MWYEERRSIGGLVPREPVRATERALAGQDALLELTRALTRNRRQRGVKCKAWMRPCDRPDTMGQIHTTRARSVLVDAVGGPTRTVSLRVFAPEATLVPGGSRGSAVRAHLEV